MQFGPNEDFAHYPRTPQADERMLAQAGCDLMFSPEVEEIYPNGAGPATRVLVPVLSDILCGAFRPGHFEGVATVVAKLFNIVAPDAAVFGEKDWQQLTVIRRMAADLCLPVAIVGAPTVREPDGLAMSSRNQYLSEAERRIAPVIYQTLGRAVERLAGGDRAFDAIEKDASGALTDAGLRVDYVAVRDSSSLEVPGSATREFVVLTAARLGKARLIDNLRVSAPL
jgi:pantoate--beta-alanine ligase